MPERVAARPSLMRARAGRPVHRFLAGGPSVAGDRRQAVRRGASGHPWAGRACWAAQGVARGGSGLVAKAAFGGTAGEESDRRRGALMAAAQAGDRAAYEALLRDCLPLIRAAVRGQGISSDRLEDVVQDVLLTLHRVRQTFDPSRSFNAWLRAIAQRRAIDVQRRQSRQRQREVHDPGAYEEHQDPAAPPEQGLDRGTQARRMREALAAL